MFIAALLTIAKSWEQPKSSSAERWIGIGGAVGYDSIVKNEKWGLQQLVFN